MGKKLNVGNLPYTVNDSALEALFAECGTIESATVITDKMSGRSKGFGFVEFASDEDAQKAIDTINGKEIDGRALTVNEARPKVPRDSRGGGFGGGGGGGGGGRGGGGGFGGGRNRY